MKSRPDSCFGMSAAAIVALSASANAEILSFNGNQATGLTTHTINASNWADYVGGSGTFNSANDWGRLYWRGSSGDGQYMHFDLSTLTGLTVVSPAMVTLQNANPTWGGSVNDSFVATANAAWTAGGGQAIPGATAITNAVNATGSYGWGASVSWGIGSTAFQSFVDDQPNFHGIAIIGGPGSTLHFSGPMNPYLTVQTATSLTSGTVIAADTGSSTWNGSNYSFTASNDYSPTLNTLTISGALIEGASGAGTMTINNGGIVSVNGGHNYYQALDGTTINAGGRLTINNHSNISNLTLAGGELASTGQDPTYGSWGITGTTTVTGGVISTISANQVSLSGGVFDVGSGSTLSFTGWANSGSLTKEGEGTMQFRGWQSYTGGTTINEGTLEVIGQNSGNGWLRGAVTVNEGGTLLFSSGDGTGFGWNSPVSSLAINGGTFNAAGGAHVGFGGYMSVSMSNGGTIAGSGQWNGDGGVGFSSSGDETNTINGSWTLRSDNGANHSFNVANGASDVDLQVNANFGDQYPEVWWVSASNLVKTGAGTMVLAGNNSYDGATIVSAGTLLVTGALGNTAVTVDGGAFGGTGTVGGSLTITSGFFHVADLADSLAVAGTVNLFAGFGIDDLTGVDWDNIGNGTYTLISGTLGSGVFSGLSNNSSGTAFSLGGGRSAYFQEGSLQLVVVPEPRAALLGGLGVLALLRRRRA